MFSWPFLATVLVLHITTINIQNGGSKYVFNGENVKVIRNIFNEEFQKQEKNIGNLISANFKITMEEIKRPQDQINKLGKEICDLRRRSRIH